MNLNELKASRQDMFAAADLLVSQVRAANKDLAGPELEIYKGLIAGIKTQDKLIDQLSAHTKPPNGAGFVGPISDHDEGSFTNYLRTGIVATANLSPNSDGGVLIPTKLWEEVTRRYAGFRPVESVARILSTDNGEPMKFPRIDDTVAGEYLAASASTGNAAPPSSLDSITLGAFKASSKPIAVSRELLTDSQYDVGTEIIGVLGSRTGRLLNTSFTSGSANTEPSGFLNGCTYPKAAGTALTLDDVLSLMYAIPQQYRKPTNVFQMSSNTQKFLRALKTGITNDQTPLWQESPRAGEPPTLYGVKVVVNDSMPDIGTAGAVVKGCVAYGDFATGFLVRKAGPAYILRYPLPQTDETGFIVFERADSKLLLPEGIAALDLHT